MALHVSNLLKDILQEEQELEKSMIASLHSNETELVSLCQQLGLPSEKVGRIVNGLLWRPLTV